jgi:hypothetical protein
MNDDEARAVLAGIDGPRPLPSSVRRDLLDAVLATGAPLRDTDTARPLPDDLRRRLEATLITATPRPVPRAVRRRIVRATSTGLPGLARAAAVLVLVAGAVLALGRLNGGSSSDQASEGARPSTESPERPSGGNDAREDSAPVIVPAPSLVQVMGDTSNPAVVAFNAYAGRASANEYSADRRTSTAGAPVAAGVTVNLAAAALVDRRGGVVFETAFVRAADVTGSARSVGLPVEDQARIAVAQAYPEPASGRAVVLASDGEPWASAADAFESALRARGLGVERSAFVPGTTTTGVSAVFLALSPADARSYLGTHPEPPSRGIHALASAYDDRLAVAGLTVVSPFAPPGGAEEARLRALVPGGRLTAEAIHGWLTAKVVEELLRRSGGTPPTAEHVADLDGWSPGWGVTLGRRGGYLLRAEDGRFAVAGPFRPAP